MIYDDWSKVAFSDLTVDATTTTTGGIIRVEGYATSESVTLPNPEQFRLADLERVMYPKISQGGWDDKEFYPMLVGPAGEADWFATRNGYPLRGGCRGGYDAAAALCDHLNAGEEPEIVLGVTALIHTRTDIMVDDICYVFRSPVVDGHWHVVLDRETGKVVSTEFHGA